MLLGDIITQGAERYPDHRALVYRDQPMTYRELDIAVRRLAAGFASLGIREGDRVALLLPNCPPFVLGYYAAAMLGAVVVPSNPLLKPAELEYIWRDADVRLVLTVPQLLPGVEAARKGLSGLRHVVSILGREELAEPALADAITGFTTLPELMATGAAAPPLTPVEQDENTCAVIIYTSGTTGHPKGAMLSHRNLIRNVEQFEGVLEFTASDCFFTALPLFHAFAGTVCMHAALSNGCASILIDNFTPARALEAIEKHKITIFPAVPALFYSLLQHSPERDYDMSSVRVFVSGGAPLPATTLTALEARYGIPVLEGDGPTECSPATSVNPLYGERKVGSVGLPLPGVEIAIFDDNDHPLGPEEIGEIVVRGDNVMLGYLNQPEATAEAMRSGWYHTGDIGKIDADGYVYILDRKKDMIITAGLNVYPREVEEVLFTHPGVADCAVIGQPDPLRGEEVVAVVVKKPEQEVAERELISYCRERLANYKVPRQVIFRDALARGGTGKVVKRLLKKELEMALPE
ncbi:MAG TPA: long-chain fatty acid--CoA ligase [Chthonomonadaceae bacterium]|nr:long-chain fatty acid--CoA ligase [Chthonomonadaceae bacterium]